ncbi:hypothetical protein [Nonomuraea wenchangensis]|uniref:hypothetical protein n=1 Tax=Nonomuraea wenchangensis TaxID=568860 RepID=UPI0037A38882
MRFSNKLIAGAAAMGAALSIGVAVTSTAASASQSAAVCSPDSRLQYDYYNSGSGGTVVSKWYNCTGSHSQSTYGYRIKPGGYSGYVYYSNGGSDYFCDYRDIYLGAKKVSRIYMAPAKIEECS